MARDMESHRKVSVCVAEKPKGWGARHTLTILGFFGLILGDCMRHNLSLTIVAMVEHSLNENISKDLANDYCATSFTKLPKLDDLESTTPNNYVHADNYDDHNEFVPIIQQKNGSLTNDTVESEAHEDLQHVWNLQDPFGIFGVPRNEKFKWTEAEQGILLGSFFWGYLITQVPGGYLSQKYGGKEVFGAGMLLTAIFSFFIPLAAKFGGIFSLMVVRFIQGLGQGVFLPSMHSILAKWIPRDERQLLTTVVYSGLPFGSAAAMVFSGALIQAFGWPAVFFILGMLTMLWLALWTSMVQSRPGLHQTISLEEKKYIESSIGDCFESNISEVPWRAILKSKPFWSILCALTAQCWLLYTFTSILPKYLRTVLHFDIKQNSVMSAVPYLLTWVTSLIVTSSTNFLIKRRFIGVLTSRKICNVMTLWVSAAALVVVAFSGCDVTVTLAFLFMSAAALGGHFGGSVVNIIDIAPKWAGILMGVINTAGAIPGILAPWIAGVLVDNDPSLHSWRIIFLIAAAVAFLGNVVFIVFASSQRQSWDFGNNSNSSSAASISTMTNLGNTFKNYTKSMPNGPIEIIIGDTKLKKLDIQFSDTSSTK